MPQPKLESRRQPIRPLPEHLANQIAAGEVVERPASIVKELLENSLDAGAGRITVTLAKGGMQLIRVQDDGSGIPADELLLALAPHATSKIRRMEDLTAISSMGFRGEALASIASVSRLQLISRHAGADSAWSLCGSHGHEPEPPVPVAHPPGTSVNVQELFFNTPARRHFLRSERTEFQHCEDVVRRIALSRFDVAFTLKHNQRTVFNLPQASDAAVRAQRLQKLCGRTFAEQAVELSCRASGLLLTGWVGLPQAARPQADLQYFFVNGRIIRDRLVSHALRQAFADMLHPGRHPAYVLYLQVAAEELDVNVHPTKHEVRFQQGRLVHDFLTRSLREALGSRGEVTSLPYARQELAWHQPAPSQVPRRMQGSSGDSPPQTGVNRLGDISPAYRPRTPAAAQEPSPALGRMLGIIHDRYLLFEHPDGLGVVDIPAMQQKWLSCQWQEEISRDGRVVSQPLLIPENLPVGEVLAEWVEARCEWLLRVGLELERSGAVTVMLRQMPPPLRQTKLEQLIPAFLGELAQLSDMPDDDVVASLSRLTVKFRSEAWQLAEMPPLFDWLDSFSHGTPFKQPFVRLLGEAELRRLFS